MGALTAQLGSGVVSMMMVCLCWKECVSQQEHIAFQSSCKPENISIATSTCLEQEMHIFSIDDLRLGGNFTTVAKAEHGSIWISGKIAISGLGNCTIHKGEFVAANCSEQHYYLCKRNATVEEELSKNDTRAWSIYVPCQRKETSVSPPSTTAGTSGTTAQTGTTSHSDPEEGLSKTAIYLIVAVAVCVIVVCIVAAVVIKRCTARKEENVTLKNVDVVREKNEGVALTENADDTPM